APIAPVGSSLTPPTLTAATGATVDSSFTVTFTENSAWRLGITNILVGATTLPTSAYSTTAAGQITFTPSASALLQTAGTLTISIGSTGYNLDKVFQNVGAGAAKKLGITAQPAAPSASGGTLVAQPSVVIQDQYGNNLSSASAITVTATVSGTAGWTLGGTTAQVTAGGIAAFTDLSASVSGSAEVDGVTITFTSSDVTISSATSAVFNILRPPAAFTSGNLAVLQADTAAGNNSTISILELNPSALNASPVNIVPISATGANALRISGASGTTGRLADSGDGSLVALAAFADGSSATADETTINQRGVGALAANASFSLRCSYTGLGSPTDNQARGATSLDNNTWYISDKGGIYTNNLNTPANTTNVRSIRSFGGSVYVLSANTTVISRVSADGTQLTPLASLPTDASAVDFYMVSSQGDGAFDTIYWLDATGKSAGTIYKYSSTDGGTTWSPQGNWPTPNGGDGFCAATNGSGGAYLYYTTGAGGLSGNSLIELTDSATRDATINIIATNTLYTAASTATLKGIAFAPVALSAAPVAITLTASNITVGSATLNASINPGGAATTYWFRYGTTTGYGSFSATNTLAAGSSPVTVTAPLTGLLQGTTYHFLVVATNSGGTSSATDASFTTLPVTPPNVGGLNVSGGAFRLAFTNATGASFSVLATNNLTAPKSTWPVVGQAVESPAGSGSYQFTNTEATNSVLFYILRQP
ncbi:MAG TPA: hypothetical protein VG347_00235, partial [Verrucomicrobiae bacterium]|nr:hypothetical protein [Verrucomicrobiae bacterium]